MSDTMTIMERALTALDRCDRCGSQAYMCATLKSGTELLFCGHHAHEHGDKIRAIPGVAIHDETKKLQTTTKG
jgi:hypothetical protein